MDIKTKGNRRTRSLVRYLFINGRFVASIGATFFLLVILWHFDGAGARIFLDLADK